MLVVDSNYAHFCKQIKNVKCKMTIDLHRHIKSNAKIDKSTSVSISYANLLFIFSSQIKSWGAIPTYYYFHKKSILKLYNLTVHTKKMNTSTYLRKIPNAKYQYYLQHNILQDWQCNQTHMCEHRTVGYVLNNDCTLFHDG